MGNLLIAPVPMNKSLKLQAIMAALALLAVTAGQRMMKSEAMAADTVSATLFARTNLAAWCIVPYDGRKRGPEERAEMLERLGFTMFAFMTTARSMSPALTPRWTRSSGITSNFWRGGFPRPWMTRPG